jgi:serine/threonine protein kinase
VSCETLQSNGLLPRVLGRDDPKWTPLPMTIRAATLLKDENFSGRFAFVMDRAWGDLRKLIDHQMMNQFGPPFALYQALGLMRTIAMDMLALHMQDPPILHNDLKAANVLVQMNSGGDGPCVDEDAKQ